MKWIRDTRFLLRVTQQDLATAMGSTQQAIAVWEKGSAKPSGFDLLVLHRLRELARTKAGRDQAAQILKRARGATHYLPSHEPSKVRARHHGAARLLVELFSGAEKR